MSRIIAPPFSDSLLLIDRLLYCADFARSPAKWWAIKPFQMAISWFNINTLKKCIK